MISRKILPKSKNHFRELFYRLQHKNRLQSKKVEVGGNAGDALMSQWQVALTVIVYPNDPGEHPPNLSMQGMADRAKTRKVH